MNAIEEYKVPKDEISELLNSLLNMNIENEWLEFKLDNDDSYMIGEYMSALSNSATLCDKDYAYLIYGIDDTAKEVVGTSF